MDNNFNLQNPEGSHDLQLKSIKFLSSISAFVLILVLVFFKPFSTVVYSFFIRLPISQSEAFEYIYDSFFTIISFSIIILLAVKIIKSDNFFRGSEILPLEKPKSILLFLLSIPAGISLCIAASYSSNYITRIFEQVSPVTSFSLEAPSGLLNIFLMVIRVAIIPAIFEELIFRGVLLEPLRKYGDAFAIFTTGLFFGLLHGSFSQIIFAFLAGIILAYFAIKTGTLWTSICIHCINNFISCVETLVNANNDSYYVKIYNFAVLAVVVLGFVLYMLFFINRKKGVQLQSLTRHMTAEERVSFRKIRFKRYFGNVPMIIAIVVLLCNLVYSSYSTTILQFIKRIFNF